MINSEVFFLATENGLICWNFKEHRQFILSRDYALRLVNLAYDKNHIDPEGRTNQELLASNLLTLNQENQTLWGWDPLSKIFHFGTRYIRLEEVPCNVEERARSYLRHCQFIIAFVPETLITKELFDLSRHMLIPGVYNLLIDHLHDEGKHSAYFSYCFEKLWSRLSESQQDFAARSLLEILLIFGRPDKEFILSLFASDTRQGELILKHLEVRVTKRIAALAIPTMQTVQRTTLLQKHALLHLFKTYGILT